LKKPYELQKCGPSVHDSYFLVDPVGSILLVEIPVDICAKKAGEVVKNIVKLLRDFNSFNFFLL
jgi:hypothetical protein